MNLGLDRGSSSDQTHDGHVGFKTTIYVWRQN